MRKKSCVVVFSGVKNIAAFQKLWGNMAEKKEKDKGFTPVIAFNEDVKVFVIEI